MDLQIQICFLLLDENVKFFTDNIVTEINILLA